MGHEPWTAAEGGMLNYLATLPPSAPIFNNKLLLQRFRCCNKSWCRVSHEPADCPQLNCVPSVMTAGWQLCQSLLCYLCFTVTLTYSHSTPELCSLAHKHSVWDKVSHLKWGRADETAVRLREEQKCVYRQAVSRRRLKDWNTIKDNKPLRYCNNL